MRAARNLPRFRPERARRLRFARAWPTGTMVPNARRLMCQRIHHILCRAVSAASAQHPIDGAAVDERSSMRSADDVTILEGIIP
jgi:hypothetical protein